MNEFRASRRGEAGDFEQEKVRWITADGERWRVFERPAPVYDRRGGTHLIFDCALIVRRVRRFPANWHELRDDALYALTRDMGIAD